MTRNRRQDLLYRRCLSSQRPKQDLGERNERVVLYMLSVVVGTLGFTYAAVPLYKIFCQETGFGGTTKRADDKSDERMVPVDGGRVIRVTFDGCVSSSLPWSFRPAQRNITLVPGETALAFYTARNDSDHPITGIATYNVQPPQAGAYFVKVQCFCFDEQRLNAKEEVDMPVLFFIDPAFLKDPHLKRVSNITLSYNFFKTGDDDFEDYELAAHLLAQPDLDDDSDDDSSSSSSSEAAVAS